MLRIVGRKWRQQLLLFSAPHDERSSAEPVASVASTVPAATTSPAARDMASNSPMQRLNISVLWNSKNFSVDRT